MPPTSQFHRGDVVLVPFPFADLTGKKVRPALIVSADPQGSELILAFITSVLTNRSPRGAEIELLQSGAEFQSTGLKADSLIRLDKLVTLSSGVISRRLGKIGPSTKNALATMLRLAVGLR
ncbi:MAG: type II toxin-antitoxin system PemK/MazF family toxin [Tepidisphaeraceae bacterium]|jgi:mRNA interferase MazF